MTLRNTRVPLGDGAGALFSGAADSRPDSDKSADELRREMGQLREAWGLDQVEMKKVSGQKLLSQDPRVSRVLRVLRVLLVWCFGTWIFRFRACLGAGPEVEMSEVGVVRKTLR